MPVASYVRKPITFTAIQFDGTNQSEVTAFCPHCIANDEQSMTYNDPNIPGAMPILVGHWVMKNEVGMWMPYSASDFLTFYAPVA